MNIGEVYFIGERDRSKRHQTSNPHDDNKTIVLLHYLRDHVLDDDNLKPEKLDKILTTLTKFAEFAMTKVSILPIAPEFELKNSKGSCRPGIC